MMDGVTVASSVSLYRVKTVDDRKAKRPKPKSNHGRLPSAYPKDAKVSSLLLAGYPAPSLNRPNMISFWSSVSLGYQIATYSRMI